MEQDSRTMSLLFSCTHRLREVNGARVYSANFTEAPGVYLEYDSFKEFVPTSASSDEIQRKIEDIRRRAFG
jgi:hypothetical protein